MFNPTYLVRDNESAAPTTTNFDALAQDLLHGRRSPFVLVFDVLGLSSHSWVHAYEHPHLRPLVLCRATLPSNINHIEWMAPDGLTYRVPSREAFLQAFQDGYASTNTPIKIRSSEVWLAASACEVLPRDESNSWSVGKTLLAIAAGAAAVGATIYGVQRYHYTHAPVSLRDPAVRAELYDRDEGTCGLCGARVSRARFHLDHRCPKVRGGEDIRANLWVTHPACNQRKGTLTVGEYRARYGSSW